MKYFKLNNEKNLWMFLLSGAILFYLLFSLVSITLSQIFISLAFIFFLLSLFLGKEKFEFPSFFWPLIAYSALSLISCFSSESPLTSLLDSPKLLLFLIVPIVYTGFRQQKMLKRVNLALLASGILSCLYSLLYFVFKASPGERIKGFMGHYMTQAGLLLLFSCMALSLFLISRDKIRFLWGLGLLLALVSLILTLTRSAWIGLVVAVTLILLLYRPKFLIIVPLTVGLFFLVSPQHVKNRALSIFSLKTPSNLDRLELIREGLKVIRESPLFGIGPNMVNKRVQIERQKEIKQKNGLPKDTVRDPVHLHNNIIQIGAERGIPALLAWMTFIVWTFISLVRLLRNKSPSLYPLTVAALASIAALFSAGLFEYNFGDSEITMLFLYMITIPFSQARTLKKENKE